MITNFVRSSVAVFSLIVCLIGGSTILLAEAEKSVESSRIQTQKAFEKVIALESTLAEQVAALKDYLFLNKNPTDLAKYQKAMSRFLITLDELENLTLETEEVTGIRRRHQKLMILANDLMYFSSDFANVEQDLRSINSFNQDINLYLNSLLKTTQKNYLISLQKSQRNTRISHGIRFVILGLVLLIFVVHLKQIILLSQNIAQKMNQLNKINQNLEQEVSDRKTAESQLQQTLKELKHTQSQLIQTEKMSSLGQLVAGIAHEINNPVGFIHGNIDCAIDYSQDLLSLIALYQQHYPQPVEEIKIELEALDIEFLSEDFTQLMKSMKIGTERIRDIVKSLRTFSRLDEADLKEVDIHQGIDSTLMILQHRLKSKGNYPEIKIIKDYGELPLIDCYSGQLNQVFMNIIHNAIDALEENNQNRSIEAIQAHYNTIKIQTKLINQNQVKIKITDNGSGIPDKVRAKLFDPFFTTKPVGKGTGLGLSICYQIIVDRHQGQIECHSVPGEGTEFVIEIPTKRCEQMLEASVA